MKKIISAKPVTEIELQFEDGKSLDIVFDTEAVSFINELDGGLGGFIQETSISERCAKVIYIGALSKQPNFILDDARKIVSELSPVTVTEILNEFNDNMGASKNGVQSEYQKKLMEQYLDKIMK